jgi:peroxiredoxin
MAKTPSTMLRLGTIAPEFELPDATGKLFRLADLQGQKATLVVFICNHCPYVIHLIKHFSDWVKSINTHEVSVIAINSNDVLAYPDDSPVKMLEFSKRFALNFPYLYDESQTVAKAYRAACTPDFFLFDAALGLVYRGQYDDSRPKNDLPITGADLQAALHHLLEGEDIPSLQKPSLGCNIKWKPGVEPDYFVRTH